MFSATLLVLIYLLTPAGVLFLCRKVKWLGTIGPVLILYILGVILGNIGWKPSGMASIQNTISTAMVPVAIPLMLFSCTFRKSETRSQVLAMVTGLVAVTATVIGGYLIFGKNIENGAKVGGMLAGVYTGGTINLASLKTMLGVPEGTFILLNSYDMMISFLYLTFLLAFGIRLFRRWLPNLTNKPVADSELKEIQNAIKEVNANPYKGLFSRAGLADLGIQLGFTALIVGISAGIGLLAGNGAFMTVFILMLTTLSIAASFLKVIKGRRYGYDVGMYFIYIFSMVVASMANLRSLNIAGGLNLLGYLTFVVFVSLFLQLLLSKIFKIDSDTTVISSVAFICSPPFVPMIAGGMRNKRVLASGLAIGVFGYAVGNYLGYLISLLLPLL